MKKSVSKSAVELTNIIISIPVLKNFFSNDSELFCSIYCFLCKFYYDSFIEKMGDNTINKMDVYSFIVFASDSVYYQLTKSNSEKDDRPLLSIYTGVSKSIDIIKTERENIGDITDGAWFAYCLFKIILLFANHEARDEILLNEYADAISSDHINDLLLDYYDSLDIMN